MEGARCVEVPVIGTRLMPTATARLSGLANHKQPHSRRTMKKDSTVIRIKVKIRKMERIRNIRENKEERKKGKIRKIRRAKK